MQWANSKMAKQKRAWEEKRIWIHLEQAWRQTEAGRLIQQSAHTEIRGSDGPYTAFSSVPSVKHQVFTIHHKSGGSTSEFILLTSPQNPDSVSLRHLQKLNGKQDQACWYTALTSTLGRKRREDREFKAILNYTSTLRPE